MDDLTEWTSDWPAGWASVGVTDATGTLGRGPDPDEPIRIASVSKLLTAYAGLLALEEESIELDEPAGPEGSTVRHLLAHASGLGFNSGRVGAPASRRLYSNTGIETFADHLAAKTGMSFYEYVREGVVAPLGMTSTVLEGSPAHGLRSTISDLLAFARELLSPTLISEATLLMARTPAFPRVGGCPSRSPGL